MAETYNEVRSPQLYRRDMWEQSGHLEHYSDNIYSVSDDMLIKPMNCPGHIQIFNNEAVTYKQLPMRLSEFGCCHRNEPSGALNGLFRVRQFVQDDAHIFCEEHQVAAEIRSFCELLDRVYRHFGFEYSVAISLRPDERAGDDALWDRAESDLISVVEDMGVHYTILEGEGAFYGPKLEFSLKDSRGRQWQCGTAQLDFILPKRLSAKYVGQDGKQYHPIMIHRAILGSLERFIAILLEHHGGVLPLWLAPTAVVIVEVGESVMGEGQRIKELCGDLRVTVDQQYDTHMMKRIKDWSKQCVPYILVIGDKEKSNNTVSVRRFGSKSVDIIDANFLSNILK